MQKRWDGLWVCRNDFEQRHPQDSVRGKRDRIRVPVSRPQILPSYDDIIALAGTGVQVMDGAEGLVDGTNIILDGTPSYLIYTGTGFTVDGGSITCDGSQSADSYIVWNPLFSGNRYKVYVQLTSYTHGSFRVYSPAGADLITNGSFATDSSWTKNAGWSISSGKAVCSGAQSAVSSINQLGSYVDGESYLTTFTLSEYSAGSCFARIGSTGVGTSRTANGTYRDCLTSDTQGRIYIYCNSTFQGSVDNFSAINIKQENAEKFHCF